MAAARRYYAYRCHTVGAPGGRAAGRRPAWTGSRLGTASAAAARPRPVALPLRRRSRASQRRVATQLLPRDGRSSWAALLRPPFFWQPPAERLPEHPLRCEPAVARSTATSVWWALKSVLITRVSAHAALRALHHPPPRAYSSAGRPLGESTLKV